MHSAGSLTDITRRKSSESLLQTDATTGLASRMWLMESLSEAIEALRQVPHPEFVLLFLNVDGFKVVNESIGLDSGDRILSQLGERLLGNVASNHLVCRYGGDEFAILMRGDTTVEDAEQLSAIIQDGLNRPFIIDGQEVFTSVSAGVTSSAVGYRLRFHQSTAARGRPSSQRPVPLCRSARGQAIRKRLAKMRSRSTQE